MANKARIKIKLKSTESSTVYTTTRKKVPNSGKLMLNKYDKKLSRVAVFKEEKI